MQQKPAASHMAGGIKPGASGVGIKTTPTREELAQDWELQEESRERRLTKIHPRALQPAISHGFLNHVR